MIRTVLLDMDGVLWRGADPVLDIQALFKDILKAGCQVFCVTNNSTKSVAMYQETLAGFGVSLDPGQFVTSAVATAAYLADRYPRGSSLFVVGEQGLRDTIQDSGFHLVAGPDEGDVAAVVVGLDRDLTYQKLNLAVRYLRSGAVFVGTNPDRTIPTPAGPAPGAGSLIAAVETSTGVEATMIGKPASHLFNLAISRSGGRAEETLMIGDRLETDILGAQRLGIRTGLVLSGISSREEADSWQPPPDRIAENAGVIIQELKSNGRKLV